MNITKTNTDGLKQEFAVVVPATEISSQIDSQIEKLSKTIRLDGFRKGKAPKTMLKQKYEASVLGEVVEDLVQKGTNEVIVSEKLRPAMQPEVKITSFEKDKDLEFSVVVENLPEIKIESFENTNLTKFMAEVPAEEVEKALKYMSQSQKTSKAVEGKVAAKGDVVVIDFVGSIDGVEFQGGKGSDYHLELGSNSFIPGFEDQLVGKKAGDKVDVKVQFPDTYHAKDLAGKDSVFAVEVKEVHESVEVELNDEFAKSLGEESLEALKTKIADRIKQDYESASRMKIKRQLLDSLDAQYSFEIPSSLATAEFDAIMSQYENAKKNNQLDEQEKNKSEDELKAEYKDIANRRVKLGLLLSEIGQSAKISILPEDINNAIMAEARKYPGQEKLVFDYYLKNKQAVEAIKAPLFEEKIVDYIISNAKVEDKIISVEDLYNFDDAAPAKKATKKKSA